MAEARHAWQGGGLGRTFTRLHTQAPPLQLCACFGCNEPCEQQMNQIWRMELLCAFPVQHRKTQRHYGVHLWPVSLVWEVASKKSPAWLKRGCYCLGMWISPESPYGPVREAPEHWTWEWTECTAPLLPPWRGCCADEPLPLSPPGGTCSYLMNEEHLMKPPTLTSQFSFCCRAAFFFQSRCRSSATRRSIAATSRFLFFRLFLCCCRWLL